MNDRSLSFSQRNSLVDIPPQMQLAEINLAMRAKLWRAFRLSLQNEKKTMSSYFAFGNQWTEIWEDWLVDRCGEFIDSNTFKLGQHSLKIRELVETSVYYRLLDFLEFVYNHHATPLYLLSDMETIFDQCRPAYRFVSGMLVPIADENEIQGVETALSEIRLTDAAGVKAHLTKSAKMLRDGDWATSIRESITAVESAARSAAPGTKDLKSALSELGKAGHLKHKALQSALNQLYGYTSDEQGIRHALVFKGEADADEAEAVFMFGACASFVSYLLKLSNSKC
ncbi:AbiJ-NTD4 domain-containing protein [Sphingorhabdus sp. SMR4y]|uniref:AbiJ-NTD4 domain-containing protein n=1 Tax=Sphingorhabdus sp. SMR4y TaxID=2584094 RepID=UPI000B612989|nr:hypothetical protein [Sphingorhabdus sp. SMR4y]ASK87000.1 hypothetical protein SPHFLASMR4Y_00208 [Sphingorhabdus sp. SMR4y]